MNRRYFILDRVSPNEVESLEMCIGALHTQRYSLDGLKLLIKTTQNDIDTYLAGDVTILGTEKTYEEIKTIVSGIEWQEEYV